MVMRFTDIESFSVDDLLLDEDNYRFSAAKNQKECIEKIGHGKEKNFKEIMTSIARDGLSDLLLVFQDKEESIVLDGNRRLAALKVLNDPKLAPSASIKKRAEELKAEREISFNDIQAQVSSDKEIIFKTIGERHAKGGGKSQIQWDAYANARFNYDQRDADPKDWKAIALLVAFEQKYPTSEVVSFISGGKFHYSAFADIIRAAISESFISDDIFSVRDQRIKKSADKVLLQDALSKVEIILKSSRDGEINFGKRKEHSRGEMMDHYYADPEGIRAYFVAKFQKPSDLQRVENLFHNGRKYLINGTDGGEASSAPEAKKEGVSKLENNDFTLGGEKVSRGNGVTESMRIKEKLAILGNEKLKSLYNSLCVVSLEQHPVLLYAGAWCFFEVLTRAFCEGRGNSLKSAFNDYLKTQLNNKILYVSASAENKKAVIEILYRLAYVGNASKHNAGQYFIGKQLRIDFETLEPFILDVLDMCIKAKEGEAK